MKYRTPGIAGNRAVSWGVRDWTIGALLQYRSGLPILSPAATNQLTGPAGSQLLTQAPTLRTGRARRSAAWTNPPAGQFSSSSSPFYNDFRYQLRPIENFNFGRTFRVKEQVSLNIRAEFTNVFNRAQPPNPQATAVFVPASKFANGITARDSARSTPPARQPPAFSRHGRVA